MPTETETGENVKKCQRRTAGTVGACAHVQPMAKGAKTQDGACAKCIAKVLAANVSQKERAMARAVESSEARRKAEREQAKEQLAELAAKLAEAERIRVIAAHHAGDLTTALSVARAENARQRAIIEAGRSAWTDSMPSLWPICVLRTLA